MVGRLILSDADKTVTTPHPSVSGGAFTVTVSGFLPIESYVPSLFQSLRSSPKNALPYPGFTRTAFDYGELFEKELKRKMSAFISLIKYAWCRMMARFWGKVADATKPKKRN